MTDSLTTPQQRQYPVMANTHERLMQIAMEEAAEARGNRVRDGVGIHTRAFGSVDAFRRSVSTMIRTSVRMGDSPRGLA